MIDIDSSIAVFPNLCLALTRREAVCTILYISSFPRTALWTALCTLHLAFLKPAIVSHVCFLCVLYKNQLSDLHPSERVCSKRPCPLSLYQLSISVSVLTERDALVGGAVQE